jgi:hypothetical protein
VRWTSLQVRIDNIISNIILYRSADEEPITTTLATTDHPAPSTQAEIEIENKTNKILMTEKGTSSYACMY